MILPRKHHSGEDHTRYKRLSHRYFVLLCYGICQSTSHHIRCNLVRGTFLYAPFAGVSHRSITQTRSGSWYSAEPVFDHGKTAVVWHCLAEHDTDRDFRKLAFFRSFFVPAHTGVVSAETVFCGGAHFLSHLHTRFVSRFSARHHPLVVNKNAFVE